MIPKFIKDKYPRYGYDHSFFSNETDIDQLIEFGYLPSSIEYCLKYDVIDDLVKLNILNQEAKWSPFEWSTKTEYLDLLSFSGFFGSINCFKFLLMNGFEINDRVLSMVVCSGCLVLFHLSQGQQFFTAKAFCKACEFFQLDLLVFMIENGANINDQKDGTPLHLAAQHDHLSVVEYLVNQKADINAKNNRVEFSYLI